MTVIDEFREALTAEIEEQKKKGTSRWDVRSGRFIETRGPLHVYSFILDDPTIAGVPDDTPVQITTADGDARGHIVGISGVRIFVALESHLGEYVPSARILLSSYYLLELLSERLATLEEASCVTSYKCMRRQSFRCQQANLFAPAEYIRPRWGDLNEEQRVAVRQALGSEVCYIWGPPGTGKTTTVGVAVASMIQCERTVLLTANTNIAVDQALKACRESLKKTEHYREGRILRLGTPQDEKISNDDNLNLDKIVERKSEPLRQQISELRAELADISARIEILGSLKPRLAKWEEVQRLIANTKAACAEMEGEIGALAVRIANSKESLRKMQERYEKAKAMPAMMRLVRRMTLAKIEKSLSNLAEENDALSVANDRAQTRLKEATERLDSLALEASQIEEELKKASTSPIGLSSEIASMQAKADDLRTQIADLERCIEAIRQEVLNQAVLIATTLARTYTMTEVYGRRFDTLVCDEASMAQIPALFWACTLATESVTVAGDPRQLAPIAQSKDSRVTNWLRRDIFLVAGVDKELLPEESEGSPMVMLRTQYRMKPQIRAIVSRVFYGDQLRDGKTDVPARELLQPCPGTCAGIYDTSAIDPWCSWTSGYSRFNLHHAVLAVRLCEIAAHDFDSIGIIAPYKAQIRLIKLLVDMNPALREKVTVSTVHRFQGREEDVIILDLVDSTGLPVGKLIKGKLDSDGARLINVACSRAKEKLAIISNLSFLRTKLDSTWSVTKVIFGEPLATFGAEQLVPGYSDAAIQQAQAVLRPLPVESATVRSLWTEDKFHSELQHDLERARRYAIIMSPFVTSRRLQTYVDLLRIKMEQGVHIGIVSRPPYQQYTSDRTDVESILSYLRQIGVQVEERRAMHQKVIVIDGKVLWFGSLTPLSHTNTQALMFRLENEDCTKQVMELCGLQALMEEGAESLAPVIDVSLIPPRSCVNCGQPMKVIPKARFGPFYKCQRCGSKANVRRDDLSRALLPEAKVCPKCGREMELRWSRRGVFLGCSGFRDKENPCKYTRSL